ncbi:hypothetical protein [Micromonospora marina]|uniref:hypothetical protein n=1 Tax=Micromonospora marina TaxID=307120 RepID=UPI003D71E538
MPPAVSRLLRWAAVIGLGIALTLAVWQDPVLAHGPARPAPAGTGHAAALTALTAMLLTARRLSVPRSPGTRRSRR